MIEEMRALIREGNRCKFHAIVDEECMPCKNWMNEMTFWIKKIENPTQSFVRKKTFFALCGYCGVYFRTRSRGGDPNRYCQLSCRQANRNKGGYTLI
jgi:hypothetical protein